MRTKAELLSELQTMLRDVLAANAVGGKHGLNHARIARAHGYVDGYMRALLELEVATKAELLELVGQERERASGPAMRVLGDVDPSTASDAKIAAA